MKKLLIILVLAIGMFACENFDIEHPDFDYTSGFFPYQYPVRTLVLGDYIYDNSNDNAHKFVISVAMGGVYENNQNRTFEFEVDESLCNRILFSEDGDTIQALPSNYYTLSSNNQIIIPSGKFNGGVEVQLTDAFFSDPKAIKNTYVVPLRLKGSADVDTILVGLSSNPNADPRIGGQWIVAPKDFTMFAVKYINEFHGTYFHYGSNSVKDSTNAVVEENTYSAKYVEQNATSKLVTTGRYQVSLTTFLNSAVLSEAEEVLSGQVIMMLNFDGNNCTITAPEGAAYQVSGTGVFKPKAYAWGNKERDGIELSYTVTDGKNTVTASDVLVARDRGVVLETYSPVVY